MSLPRPPCHNNQALTSLPHPFPPPSPDQISRPLSAGLEIRLRELKLVTARGFDGRVRRGVAGWEEPPLTLSFTPWQGVLPAVSYTPLGAGRMERGDSAPLTEGWPVMPLNISESASAFLKGEKNILSSQGIKSTNDMLSSQETWFSLLLPLQPSRETFVFTAISEVGKTKHFSPKMLF